MFWTGVLVGILIGGSAAFISAGLCVLAVTDGRRMLRRSRCKVVQIRKPEPFDLPTVYRNHQEN
jgi:hypothetical protein